ncbi:hypothetical protein [Nibricoccus sp. IMCC34717]|uniref:hypothetical protein n=1 Tax=Nibricoccus sp. IMCC34717 TaxID=3034021 RepID=UPI00384E809F
MLAILYLVLAWAVGRCFWGVGLGSAASRALAGVPVPPAFVREPVAWISGTVALTWLAYLGGLMAQSADKPLIWGNTVAFAAGSAFLLWSLRRGIFAAKSAQPAGNFLTPSLAVGAATLVVSVLACATFRTRGPEVIAGVSVFSDFGPHTAVIRSFSFGHNFPTEYPLFPDGTARYHFLFQFLAGNLEFLGLPLGLALNVPSILAFASAMALLYSLAVALSGRPAVGVLSCVLFLFRSGLAGFAFAWNSDSLKDIFLRLWDNDLFIGLTEHEDWGLWNLNVYLNQRHLALGLAVLFFSLLAILPLIRRSLTSFAGWRHHFLSLAAWLPRRPADSGLELLPVAILVGATGFWNGATVIAVLLAYAAVTPWVLHRLETAVVAVVVFALGWVQNSLFLGSDTLAVKPELWLGFLAEPPRTLGHVSWYVLLLLGALPFVAAGGVVAAVRSSWDERPRLLSIVFLTLCLAPLALAFTIKLTPDVAINHKYVMIAVMLLNVLAATALVRLWRLPVAGPIAAILVFVALTFTGIVDLLTLISKVRKEQELVANTANPVNQWVVANTDPREIFLTDWHSFHPLLMSGRKIFYGWPYYAWSAGYDTGAREKIVKEIYGGTDWERTQKLMRENRLRYVFIDDGNRRTDLYKLQENFLRSHLREAFRFADTVILELPPTSSAAAARGAAEK